MSHQNIPRQQLMLTIGLDNTIPLCIVEEVCMEAITKFLKQFLINQRQKTYANELLQYAKAEYGLEWQHAYHMMLQGKRPQPNGRVK